MKKVVSIILFCLFLMGCQETIPYSMQDREPPCLIEAADIAIDWWNDQLGFDGLTFKLKSKINKVRAGEVVMFGVQPEYYKEQHTVTGYADVRKLRSIITMRLQGNKCEEHPEVIAAHEIGHSLGLNHSKDKNNIMYYISPPQLHDLTDFQLRVTRNHVIFWAGNLVHKK